MSDFSFDRLLDGLGEAMTSAQAVCRRHREQLLRRRLGSDGDGDDRVMSFPVQLLGQDGWQAVDVPVIDLIQRRDLGISEMTVELDCELRLRPPRRNKDGHQVVARIGGGRARHRLRVTLLGVDAPQGEVFLDDVFLRPLAVGNGNGGHRPGHPPPEN